MKDLLNLNEGAVGELEGVKEHFYSYVAILSRIIFAYRIKAEMTQQQLADKSGISIKTIYRAEGGASNISVDAYQQIFQALGKDFGKTFDEAVAESNRKRSDLIMKNLDFDEEPFIVDENGRVTNFDWNNPKHRVWIEED